MVAHMDKSSARAPDCAPPPTTNDKLRCFRMITSVRGPHSVPALDEPVASKTNPCLCPVCGQVGGQVWLHGPDRFHGRREDYALVRCPACSLVWLRNPPKPSEMHLHYTDAYHHLISAAGKNSPERWRKRKSTLTQYKQSGTLLDLGCSSGSFLEFIGDECWKLYGIEM